MNENSAATNGPDIHNPVRRIDVRGELITVKELVWKDCLQAVREMTATVLQLLGPGGTTMVLDKEKIVAAITQQEQLVTWVLEKATGKPQDWIATLRPRELLPLVEAAVELNLSDEVVKSGKALAGRMGGVFGQTKPSPARSTP